MLHLRSGSNLPAVGLLVCLNRPPGGCRLWHLVLIVGHCSNSWKGVGKVPSTPRGFQPSTFRLRDGCSASNWTAPDGSSLLTWDGSSIQTVRDGSRRIVWMIKRMIKCHPTENRMPRQARSPAVVSNGMAAVHTWRHRGGLRSCRLALVVPPRAARTASRQRSGDAAGDSDAAVARAVAAAEGLVSKLGHILTGAAGFVGGAGRRPGRRPVRAAAGAPAPLPPAGAGAGWPAADLTIATVLRGAPSCSTGRCPVRVRGRPLPVR
jgi:hypothetical protein